MQRINTSYFYRLATKLIALRGVTQGRPVLDFYGDLYGADEELHYFLSNSLIPPISSRGAGEQLLQAIRRVHSNLFTDTDTATDSPSVREVPWDEAQELRESLRKFEVALQSDFSIRDTFIVSPKAAYSTTLLAENGETLVSEAARQLVPSMKRDLHDAGRCMAFELPTAAAFHLFRAVEAMVCSYGEFVREKPFTQSEKKRGLGGYANCLKQKNLNIDAHY